MIDTIRSRRKSAIILSISIIFFFSNILNSKENTETAIFAGGCFWCMEGPFEKLPGVVSVISGYSGGQEKNPTYEDVGYGRTGHRECVKVTYDPKKIGYAKLLDTYWRQIDPTDSGGQFADRGNQYRAAIYYKDEAQRKLAQEFKDKIEASKKFPKPIAVEILKAGEFYPAEEYHQDYYKKNPEHYRSYRKGSGREDYLIKVWGESPK
ncbi:peptide-methionine (S)-S-oxide reductase [Leptospira wolffii]|uniref:Peptide methionine sulfoxide reductase MsrA n=1 Tax=Leptospira wolffii TaxID=409998 RepID=A0A2M9ZG61_9LEPT|nr:peptide-methionine (S)-S-oxide reductase MsrA [Leptospira wolffii]PJZ67337.1 peptide-methionine (S)-S-oxide reductase [Leptospira wolffii]TGK62331.1 peptide-methionine (S)-S-oxide reductase [Leptospira wolffii]TGK68152.1 peptide-methionine (S)-S-oxide reductase [Leptospira wolffii]TGK74285.1 peptide-methionine (S)-S-oxide reductase [Leptospira wolffii]TGL32140.1 peptide-methionine (S)-S-oxide reductase [Leptospira wolffii]